MRSIQRHVSYSRDACPDRPAGRLASSGPKPLKGYKGAGVLEIIDDFDGDTYRAVYTIRFEGVVFALDAFQKKSRKGIATSKSDLDRINVWLKRAEEIYAEWLNERNEGGKDKG